MNPSGNKFFDYILKAKEKKDKGKYAEALQLFHQAKNCFGGDEGPFDKFVVLEEIAEMNRRLRNFKQSKYFYKEAKIIIFQELKNNQTHKPDVLSAQYQLLCNEALLHTDQAQTMNAYDDWPIFKNYIDFSVENLIKAYKIVVNVLVEGNLTESQEEWWSEQYIGSIINLINPLELEAEKFEDNNIYEIIVMLSDKVSKFYDMSSHKRKLRDNLSKSYYFRAISFSKLKKYTEADIYFKRDYEYCKKYDKREDLQKTRKSYICFLISLERLQEVKKYITSTDEKRDLADLIKFQTQVQDQIRFLEEHKSTDKIQALLQNLAVNKFYRKISTFAHHQLPKYTDSETLFCLRYHLALACFENDAFKQGYSHIIEALKLCDRKQTSYFDSLLLRIQYGELLQTERGKMIEMLKELRQLGEEISDKNYYDEAVKAMSEYQIRQKRGKRFKDFDLSFEEEKHLFGKIKQSKQINRKDQNAHDGRMFFLSTTNTRKTKKQETLEKYEKLMHEKNIPPRKYLLHIIQQSQPNSIPEIDLAAMFNFGQKEIEVLLDVFTFSKLDFGNHHISIHLLEKLNQENILYSIKYFKISNNIIKIQLLQKLTRKMKSIQQLVLKNVTSLPKNPSLIFPYPDTIKILKLKHCQLTDQDLSKIQINLLQNLQELDLAGNCIDGTCLNFIDELKEIRQLNLSQNPLNNVKMEGKNKLERMKLKGIHGMRKISSLILIKQLLNSRIIDLSENTGQTVHVILGSLIESCYQREVLDLPHLVQLRLKRCNLNGQCLKNVRQMVSMSTFLTLVDFRFCYWEEEWDKFKMEIEGKESMFRYQIMNPFSYNYKRKQH